MARRTKAEALETRAQIIDAAEHVFHRKGVARTSLNDIAQEAGVSRGAIYWHFKNKHDVFEAMLSRHRLPTETLSQRAGDPDETDPLGRLREVLVDALQRTVHDPGYRRVFEILFYKCEFTKDTDPLMSRVQESFLDSAAKMHRTLRNAIERGQLPTTLNVDRAITLLHVQMTGLLYTWLLLPDSFDLETEATDFVDCYIASLRQCPTMSGVPDGEH
ncbi:TetR family transcriptional regulator [Alloalcanivorax gelatiniphagus]|uniref:TetR family transcriptional regulator n=1 Tax=Alloalcanivorax gelatiniphagus TaxID=1194167 RepID=A0ABY2XPD5_9GAMM|nr:TetR family transcriptional regulator [Alloalcanivorax gelatiniphagus]TMW14420.1 TetR family transcriptional regulator [Alloalcanivorax gelatiniphagus]|tara:strand:+ start:12607 stop:13257 length:651 start_codon:yes stop_codon:yes gene_type:complete